MNILGKDIDFDDLFRRLLALPPKDEEWYSFNVPKKMLSEKGWSGKNKVEIFVNEDTIIFKKVKV